MYFESNVTNLNQINLITRIPANIGEERKVIENSIKENAWERLDEENKFSVKHLEHYNIQQRWIIAYSTKARSRAEKTLEKSVNKKLKEIEEKLWHLSNQPFDCAADAEKSADKIIKKCRYHKAFKEIVIEKNIHEGLGRPRKGSIPIEINYFVSASIVRDKDLIKEKLDKKSCYVIVANVADEDLIPGEVITAYILLTIRF